MQLDIVPDFPSSPTRHTFLETMEAIRVLFLIASKPPDSPRQSPFPKVFSHLFLSFEFPSHLAPPPFLYFARSSGFWWGVVGRLVVPLGCPCAILMSPVSHTIPSSFLPLGQAAVFVFLFKSCSQPPDLPRHFRLLFLSGKHIPLTLRPIFKESLSTVNPCLNLFSS